MRIMRAANAIASTCNIHRMLKQLALSTTALRKQERYMLILSRRVTLVRAPNILELAHMS